MIIDRITLGHFSEILPILIFVKTIPLKGFYNSSSCVDSTTVPEGVNLNFSLWFEALNKLSRRSTCA